MTQSTSSRWKLSSLREFLPVLSGCCLGLLALQFVHFWISAFGVSVVSQSVAVCCLGAGIWFSSRWGRRIQQGLPVWGSWVLCVAMIGVIPLIVNVSSFGMRLLPTSWMSTSIGQFITLFPSGLLMISLPWVLLQNGRSSDSKWAHRGWGIAAGMSLGWLWLLPAWGAFLTLCVAAGVLCVCAAFEFRSEPNVTPIVPAISTPEKTRNSRVLSLLLPLGLGFLWPAVSNIVTAWALSSVWGLDARITAVVFGFMVATCWTRAFPGTKGRSLELSLIVLMFAAGDLAGGQEAWISFALTLHSNVSQPWLLELGRFLFIGSFPFVAGTVLGLWKKTQTSENSFANGTVLAIGGWLSSVLFLSQGIDPKWVICAGIGVMTVTTLVASFLDSAEVKWTVRMRWPALITTVAGMTCLASAQHNSILPARLMYSGFAKSQHQAGTDLELLPYLDEGRPVSVTHSAAGTWVGVDYRGLETFFHRNGVPTGYVSHDNRIMPDSPVDLMITTLPVVMHESPKSVCFLGWGTGVPIATALDFPLQKIDCFERDAILPNLTFSSESSTRYGLNPFQDDRVRLESIPPEFAVRAVPDRYDVVISQPVRTEEIQSVAEFTREFYRACADRMNGDGLFCQRYQHLDHGPDASIDVARTLKSVFPFVAMVDTSPGETLFFASRSRDLDKTEYLVERLQRLHVRRILARCGWDWAHVLKLPSIDSKSLDQLLTESGGRPNSILNHSIAVTHPSDAMRWSNKWEEKIERFSPYKKRYADLAGEPGRAADVTRRMEEIGSQRFAMTKVTDKPWAYRASIKELLQTKPRSILIQTKGEKPHNEMHPVDQHRVDYLKALSRAYRDKSPSAENIHALTNFIEPYDPLISFFLHYEAAELYSRNPELDPRAEYLHLLNTIYFADMQDRSIHNVIRAMELVHEHPEIVESDQTRFDQLHGLVQTLLNRWQLRQGETPASTDEGLTDIDDSLEAASTGIKDLQSLAESSGYGEEAWSQRERILEQMLVRPLRGYRGKLLPYHEKSLRQKNKQGERESGLENAVE